MNDRPVLPFLAVLLTTAGAAVAAGWALAHPAPPHLSADEIAVIGEHRATFVLDQQATQEHAAEATLLADRYGPDENSPEQVVLGVGLGHVTDEDAGIDRMMWVVLADQVVSRCFGPSAACPEEEEMAHGLWLIDPQTLRGVRASVF